MPSFLRRLRWLFLLAGSGLSFFACGDARDTAPLMRIGSLLPVPEQQEAVDVAADLSVDHSPQSIETKLDAARVARLMFRGRGNATMLSVEWMLAADRSFRPFRRLDFPLFPDQQEHDYEINLQREPYWHGAVRALRLSAIGGTVDLVSVMALPPSGPFREMSLRGKSLPALPGVSRLAVGLPAQTPSPAAFETHIGLVPEYDRPGVRARFRAYSQRGQKRQLWIDEELQGAPGLSSGWRFLRRSVSPPRDGALILEVEATENGQPLPEGVALWGNPILAGADRPPGLNLMIVLVDTLRADAVGTYGNRLGLTPTLDNLARDAIRFAQLQAPAPWTLASVASLFTGLHPQTHGAGRRSEGFAPTGLPEAIPTLAEVLASQGFFTSAIYHNIYLMPAFGVQQGFDSYTSYEERAEFLVDRALAELDRLRERRFFFYLHLFDPHTAYEPPEKECRELVPFLLPDYQGPLRCSIDRRPELPMPPPEDWPLVKALYYTEVAYTDRQLGRFFNGIAEFGLDDRTVILVLSDHGEDFWSRPEQSARYDYQLNADHGHTHYQELLHVPALLLIPGGEAAVIEQEAELVDLFATLLGLLDVTSPASQGRDLAPLFDGETLSTRPLLSDFLLHGRSRWAIRRGPWKLVTTSEGEALLELYNLDQDPDETRNLVEERPEIAATLLEVGQQELAERQAERLRRLSGADTHTATYLEWRHITKLRALGYLQ